MLFMYGSLHYHNKTIFSSFIAAIMYGGCITFMRHSLLWDFMADAIVFLPLVIWGLDKIYYRKETWTFLSSCYFNVSIELLFCFYHKYFHFHLRIFPILCHTAK